MLETLIKYEKIDQFDIYLADLLVPDREQALTVYYSVLLLSRAVRSQHSCLPLNTIDLTDPFKLRHTEYGKAETPFGLIEELYKELASYNAVGQTKPIRIVENNLYFARFDEYEKGFVNAVKLRNNKQVNIDDKDLTKWLNHYFPPTKQPDWQKVACAIACLKPFCIISGGPGTGKTTTVIKLLAVLQSLYKKTPLKIKLVAPTGKAAQRLSESIVGAKQRLSLEQDIATLIPDNAQTLHRLLGVIHLSNQFKHHRLNPIDADLVVLDEASMVDLAMLSKLFDALPENTRVIFLGDKDQLSSVDAGNVMSDLCRPLTLGNDHSYAKEFSLLLSELTGVPHIRTVTSHYSLNDNLAYLQYSHRFDEKSGIGQLAKAVNKNDIAGLADIIKNNPSDLLFTSLETEFKAFIEAAAEHYQLYFDAVKANGSIEDIHKRFASFQILSATRVGPYGTEQLNKLIEKELITRSRITMDGHCYVGMPLMISENNYQLNLFNGDIGIVIKDENNRLMASFIDESGKARLISVTRLPSYDKVYAMTIHKSQGSEFEHVAMVLPANSPVINRQLVYTGITRAKKSFELVATENGLQQAMDRVVSRYSGLYSRFQSS
jgi:exodeoxyribonuclease V alpha subunit